MSVGWPNAKLQDLATIVGRGITPKYSADGDFLVINQKCVRDGRLSLGQARRHDSSMRRVRAEKVVVAGDILVNSTGVGTLGRTAPVLAPSDTLTADSHVTIVRPNSDIDPRWLAYAVSFAEPQIEAMAEGSTGQTELSRHRLAELELCVPPILHQQNIARTLAAFDDKIESNRRAIELIDELVRARFDRDFNVEQAVDGVAIGDLVSINCHHKLVRGEVATYVGMSSLPEFSPTILEWDRRAFGTGQKFVNGDVLMARITPCLENGKTAVVDMLGDGDVGWGSTEYIVLSPRGAYSTPWIYALARNQTIRDWAISRMTGTSGRQRFQATEFDQYRIQEPEHGALAAFNVFAVPLFQKATQARDEIKLLQQLRDALLPELLSGRIWTTSRGDA